MKNDTGKNQEILDTSGIAPVKDDSEQFKKLSDSPKNMAEETGILKTAAMNEDCRSAMLKHKLILAQKLQKSVEVSEQIADIAISINEVLKKIEELGANGILFQQLSATARLITSQVVPIGSDKITANIDIGTQKKVVDPTA